MKKPKVRIGISMGDPNGIGPEVILKTLAQPGMTDDIIPIIYGSQRLFNHYLKVFELEEFKFHIVKDTDSAKPKKVNLIDIAKEDFNICFGERSEEAGKIALQSLEAATSDLASNKFDVLVTAPIDKKAIQSDEFDFPGHTEYLAKMSAVDEALMLMVSENLRVGIVTGHIPLKDVPGAISKDKIIGKIDKMLATLEKDFAIRKPKIAVLGLNPHAGEKGMMGTEESDVISPAVNAVRDKGHLVYGPYPADGFFGSSSFKEFDGVLAMYHDQGLAPFKALSFGYGVNYTAGLPIVRTSPDHGTAFEIAGKGLANEASFRSAVFLAKDIYNNRTMQREITADPLQPQKTKNNRSDD